MGARSLREFGALATTRHRPVDRWLALSERKRVTIEIGADNLCNALEHAQLMAGYTLHVETLTRPAIVVHGGAGAYLKTTTVAQRARRGEHLLSVATNALEALRGAPGARGREAVLHAIGEMELDERYNAGIGSKLQRDGVARVSAAIMDGAATRLGAVYNARDCLHPSRLAAALLEHGDRNLDGEGARELMVELGLAPRNLRTARSIARWRDLVAKGDTTDAEGAIADAGREGLDAAREADLPVPDDLEKLKGPDTEKYGTVGAVAVDADGDVWACTSTGGRGHERVGRVSDTPTPAGNYACPRVAISATGFGEQILDLNICGRIATRVLDGATLRDALGRTFEEVVEHDGLLGVIAITNTGEAGYAYSTEACGVAWCDDAGNDHIDPHGRG